MCSGKGDKSRNRNKKFSSKHSGLRQTLSRKKKKKDKKQRGEEEKEGKITRSTAIIFIY